MATVQLYVDGHGFYGYQSGNSTYGYYNVYFNYDSLSHSGDTLTITNGYAEMKNPNSGYTTNTVYIDSVKVNGTSAGLSTSANGGTSYHSFSTSKKTFSVTVSAASTSCSVTVTGHSTGVGSQTLSGTLNFSASTGSFNLNILNPDGSEPYTTGAAGKVDFSSNGGSTYSSQIFNEPASSYVWGTSFKCKNFQPGTGRYLASVSGFNETNTDGPWTATQGDSTVLVFKTGWNTYYRDINAYNPSKSAQGGVTFRYYIYDRDGNQQYDSGNVTNEVANTVTREYGYTGKMVISGSAVTGAHYSGNNITNDASTTITWTYDNTQAIELYTKWNSYTVAFNANGGSGTLANQSFTYSTAQNLRSNTFTRVGYHFLGWSTNSSATSATYTNGQSVNNLTTTNNGTVTLYAVWEKNDSRVKVNGDWKSGDVYVKVNGAWKRGTMYIKVNGAWKQLRS